jgi:hypothetical protein
VRRVVPDPELPAKQCGDSGARPAVAPEAPRLGSLGEQRGDAGLLLRCEARRSAGRLAVAQGGFAPLPGTGEPLADGAVGDAQSSGNLAHPPALLEQAPGASATPLPPSAGFLCMFTCHSSFLPMTGGG